MGNARENPTDIACPVCGAAPGANCRDTTTGINYPKREPHQARNAQYAGVVRTAYAAYADPNDR